MTKRHNITSFEAIVNGKRYEFEAYTTHTRNGFCHTIITWVDYHMAETTTKVSYINRTWESFQYETVLRRAIEKCPKEDRQLLVDILVDKTRKQEQEKAEAFVSDFENVWSNVNDKYKNIIRDTFGTIETQEQADAVMAASRAAILFQKLEH